MAEHLTRDEFTAHMEPIKSDIKEIIQLQREANGRTSKNESRIAVLEDRSPGRVSASVSAVISGLVAGIGIWFSKD